MTGTSDGVDQLELFDFGCHDAELISSPEDVFPPNNRANSRNIK